MRVIAGEYRGRPLKAPKGQATRPTTDRVRESLMSSIMSARGTWEGAVVLDAFAGSGALGIESLSRGARFACFCERDNAALEALAANTSFLERSSVRIMRTDVVKRPPVIAGYRFDLVFLDPPYAMGGETVATLIDTLGQRGALDEHALIAYEHDKNYDPCCDEAFDSLELTLVTHKVFGDTVVDLLRKELA
jgi:16S rRNA (guanine966-N2)-methyltransferase